MKPKNFLAAIDIFLFKLMKLSLKKNKAVVAKVVAKNPNFSWPLFLLGERLQGHPKMRLYVYVMMAFIGTA